MVHGKRVPITWLRCLHTHMFCTAVGNTHACANVATNTSARVSHTCDDICNACMLYDVIIGYRHKISLFCAPTTWYIVPITKTIRRGKVGTRDFGACNAINVNNEYACNEYLLYMTKSDKPIAPNRTQPRLCHVNAFGVAADNLQRNRS